MKTLHQAIEAHNPRAAQALKKHLTEVGVHDWNDLSRLKLNDFKEHLNEVVAPNSAKTYCAVLGAVLGIYKEEVPDMCKDYAQILKAKGERPQKTFLTQDELQRFEQVETLNEMERYIKLCFMISARTGMRVSDTRDVRPENIVNGWLTYVSKKTSTRTTVPCSDKVAGWIQEVNEHPIEVTLMWYNKVVRKLAERAGITEPVRVYKAGKSVTERKCDCLSSHSARISAATNLAIAGVPIADIKAVLGHSSVAMTERYIVPHKVELTEQAMAFFK